MPEMAPVRALKGMKDVLWPASYRWEVLVATFAGLAQRAGYIRKKKPHTLRLPLREGTSRSKGSVGQPLEINNLEDSTSRTCVHF